MTEVPTNSINEIGTLLRSPQKTVDKQQSQAAAAAQYKDMSEIACGNGNAFFRFQKEKLLPLETQLLFKSLHPTTKKRKEYVPLVITLQICNISWLYQLQLTADEIFKNGKNVAFLFHTSQYLPLHSLFLASALSTWDDMKSFPFVKTWVGTNFSDFPPDPKKYKEYCSIPMA